MKRLFTFVQEYISTLSILEFGALKVCLMCLGLIDVYKRQLLGPAPACKSP